MKNLIAILLIFSVALIQAQEDTTKHKYKKHKIFFSPTSVFEDTYPVVYGTNSIWGNIGYEYQIRERHSIGIKTGYIIFNGDKFGFSENINRGYFVTAYYKFYIIKNIYLGVNIGHQYNSIIQKESFNDKLTKTYINRLFTNIRIGFETNKNVYIDFGLGSGYSYYFNNSYWAIVPRIEMNIGYKF